MMMIIDQVLSKGLEFLSDLLMKIPPVRRFRSSKELARALWKYRFLFSTSSEYIYSVHAFCQTMGENESSRALALRSSVDSLARLSPTLSASEWDHRLTELRRILNETRQLVAKAGIAPKAPNCPEIYSQLQPRLNEFCQALEDVVDDRTPRFPSDMRFLDRA